MNTKLIQKHFLKGVCEYEIDDEQVSICIKSRFKEERQTVTLAVLDPEPVITRKYLQFLSRVNREPLLSLVISKPNVAEFNAFINILKQRAQSEYESISGVRISSSSRVAAGQSDALPPEFDDASPGDIIVGKKIDIDGLKSALQMLQTYVTNEEINPLLNALEELIDAPEDKSRLIQVATLFNGLETTQGAVLTYAPYIGIMLSDDPFEY